MKINDRIISVLPALKAFSIKLNRTNDWEELLNNTVVRILTYQDSYKEEFNFKHWAFKVCVSVHLETFKKAKTKKREHIESNFELDEGAYFLSYLPNQENIVYLKELQKSVKNKYARRNLFNDETPQDTAEIFGVSKRTIESNIYYARKQLREFINERSKYISNKDRT